MNGRGGLRGAIARYRGRDIELKTPRQLQAMRESGALVAATLAAVTEHAKPGVSTAELDALAEQTIRDGGGVPSFLGYHGFPGSICASVNEQIVHGIPSAGQVLADGDLLSVDCGAILDGWHGDSAVTIAVGEVSPADLALSAACRGAMDAGVVAVQDGARLTDVSYAIQEACRAAAEADRSDYGIVAEYGGHGIGTSMHMDPFLPNHGEPGRGPRLRPGMALTVEPMLVAGDPETVELDDGWTVVTASGGRAVHWEHTVAVTEDGPWLLTAPAGAPDRPGS
ncbi:Methionine aminopeptidase [Pseudonocardia sp. Ae168_Ps1]|uniref:type I methionyl aminopeptidase n=1 Tax=unclassified Pseudonocardia TaxID=2619320 RepID=UPI00094B60AD|nr:MULTISPECIES: type I methionyl aminopeptidase [unclassified Pseudonocardia]OLL74126.1 Methionine aminopeptidase [Pseudonocardia sp. Ae150A_Ps1]OLL80105.1 Methionine aminopeptidase [Pseudonocardia sp. Ae168_Ps1]OLL85764.1 Methionine aminopeptidase [Pseudonocardia sp. Ae263_Ps1]OLL94205.1 Methionine aminopeptidase [Pseudonocardia sp. Ae356_Ps1]